MVVISPGAYAAGRVQIAYDRVNKTIAIRWLNTTWSPWEYQNPLMSLGVEYRTTERHLGKPVYVMAVDFGALPNTTSKTLWSTPTANVNKIIDYGGEGAGYALPYDGTNYIKLTCALTGSNVVSVTVTTGTNYSSSNATIWFKYTKTTD